MRFCLLGSLYSFVYLDGYAVLFTQIAMQLSLFTQIAMQLGLFTQIAMQLCLFTQIAMQLGTSYTTVASPAAYLHMANSDSRIKAADSANSGRVAKQTLIAAR